jgi:hypothetical protein
MEGTAKNFSDKKLGVQFGVKKLDAHLEELKVYKSEYVKLTGKTLDPL